MKYTILADHSKIIDMVSVSVYAKDPDEAVALVSAMGFVNIVSCTLGSHE